MSPHRRSDTLPRVAELDARNFQTIVRYPLPLIDESLRLRTSGQPLNRSHRHDPAGTSGLDGGRSRRPGASRPRRNSRDQDLRHPREHAYGPRIPLVRPGERQSVYDWAPVPAPVPPASAPGIDDDLTSRSLPPPFDHEEYLARYFPFMSRDFSAMFEAGGFRLPGDAPRSQQPDLFGGIFTTGSDGGGASNSSSSSVTTTSSSATAPASARITHPRRRSRVYWPEPAMSSSRDHQDRDRMMDDAEWDGSDTMLLSRLSRARYAYERLSDSRLPEASKEVEKAIEYLAKVRGCRTTRESISLVVRLGFYSEDDWERLLDEHPNFDDFVSDTSFLRVAETSWLEAGGIFWGSQIAPAMSPVHDTSSTRSNASSSGSTSSQWTVKLSISSIDYWQLRLSKSTLLPTVIPIPLRETQMADQAWFSCLQRVRWRRSRMRRPTSKPISRARLLTSTDTHSKPSRSQVRWRTMPITGAS